MQQLKGRTGEGAPALVVWFGLYSPPDRGDLESAITESTVNLPLTNSYTHNGGRSCDPTPEEGGLLGPARRSGPSSPIPLGFPMPEGRDYNCR